MTSREAADLIRSNEGRLCARIYRTADGTILTDNCPVGLRKVRDRLGGLAVSAAVLLAYFGIRVAAQGQGLIGAPIDGGVSRVPTSTAEIVELERRSQLGPLCDFAWVVLMGLWAVLNFARPKVSITKFAFGLVCISLAMGLFYGLNCEKIDSWLDCL